MTRIERWAAFFAVVAWFTAGLLLGRVLEHYLHADRPPDSMWTCPEIPEINRVTWKNGERRT